MSERPPQPSGAVAATRLEAIRAGELALERGGNAIDAAVAAGFALAVVEPYMTGPGAVGEMVYMAPDGACVVLDAAAHAPLAAREDMFVASGAAPASSAVDYGWTPVEGQRNRVGPLAATAPRLVNGLAAFHDELGRLPWASLVAPAVDLADAGIELDFFTSAITVSQMQTLIEDPLARRLYFPGGIPLEPPLAGRTRIAPNPELAATLRAISEQGGSAMVEGPSADAIVRGSQAAGGILVEDDLRVPARIVPVTEPLTRFRGWSVFGSPYPSGATTAAQILLLLDDEPPVEGGPTSPARFVASARAASTAIRIRLSALAGSDGAERVAEVLRTRRTAPAPAADAAGGSGAGPALTTTTHVSTMDADGGVVALTLTLLSSFGCQWAAPGTGFFLSNGMWWFDPIPGRPQSIAPGARALSAVSPLVAVSPDRRRRIGIGGLGARPIFASVAQVLAGIIDDGLDIAQAVDMPRVVSDGARLYVDERAPAEAAAALRAELGPVHVVPYNPVSMTNARLAVVDTAPPEGGAHAAVDARARATFAFGQGALPARVRSAGE